MATYQKQSVSGGAWITGKDLNDGDLVKIVAETTRRESQFKNEDGSIKMEDVTKIRVKGRDGTFNYRLNRVTIDGLIDAFGGESKDWCNNPLTVATEKVKVGGKSHVVAYLVPEAFEVMEDDEGYTHIVSKTNAPIKKEDVDPNNGLDAVLNDELPIAADEIPF